MPGKYSRILRCVGMFAGCVMPGGLAMTASYLLANRIQGNCVYIKDIVSKELTSNHTLPEIEVHYKVDGESFSMIFENNTFSISHLFPEVVKLVDDFIGQASNHCFNTAFLLGLAWAFPVVLGIGVATHSYLNRAQKKPALTESQPFLSFDEFYARPSI